MRGTAALFPAKCKLNQLYPLARSWGKVSTSTPVKRENNESMEKRLIANEMSDPIVAFSRPPPLPPVLGSLVALSLLEMLLSHDGEDD